MSAQDTAHVCGTMSLVWSAVMPTDKPTDKPTARLTVRVDSETRRLFRTVAASHDLTMAEALERLVRLAISAPEVLADA